MNKDPEYGEELVAWTERLFTGEQMSARKAESYERLRQAVCIISDVAWSQHLDFRGLIAAETVLHATCHPAVQVFIANAALYRHRLSKYPETRCPRGFIPVRDKARKLSGALGLCLRLEQPVRINVRPADENPAVSGDDLLILEIPKKQENWCVDKLKRDCQSWRNISAWADQAERKRLAQSMMVTSPSMRARPI